MSATLTQSPWSLLAGRLFLAASILFFCLTLGAGLWTWVGPPTWDALLRCPQSTHDFGTLPAGEVRRHGFLLRNEGRRSLTLKRVISSCGCLVSDFEEGRTLQPGESTTVKIRIDFTGMKGRVAKELAVEWEGASKREPLILTVVATVQATP